MQNFGLEETWDLWPTFLSKAGLSPNISAHACMVSGGIALPTIAATSPDFSVWNFQPDTLQFAKSCWNPGSETSTWQAGCSTVGWATKASCVPSCSLEPFDAFYHLIAQQKTLTRCRLLILDLPAFTGRSQIHCICYKLASLECCHSSSEWAKTLLLSSDFLSISLCLYLLSILSGS